MICPSIFRPVQLKTVSQELDVSSSLFFKVWSDLASEDELNGKVIGGKNSLKALYVPTFHDTNVRRYIEKRLTTDSFIGIFFRPLLTAFAF